MDLQERIRAWTLQKAAKFCKQCRETCCDGTKHNIIIEESGLEVFKKQNIPVIALSELTEETAHNIIFGSRRYRIFTKDSREVSKPAMVQTERAGETLSGENEYLLYVKGYCPFYSKGQGCRIHEDPGRASVCKNYPVFYSRGVVWFNESCKFFGEAKTKKQFARTFPCVEIVDEPTFLEKLYRKRRESKLQICIA